MARNGRIAFEIDSIFSPETEEATNSTSPIGGVASPTVRLTLMIIAIIMSVNLTVGLATPPMGLVLFVASSVSGEKIESISKAILPFLAIEVIVIFLITYVEPISLGIPRFFGFISGG